MGDERNQAEEVTYRLTRLHWAGRSLGNLMNSSKNFAPWISKRARNTSNAKILQELAGHHIFLDKALMIHSFTHSFNFSFTHMLIHSSTQSVFVEY